MDCSVLLVDDDPALTEVATLLLGSRGLDVTVAGSVAEARALLDSHSFRAVVLDLGLPGEPGEALLAYLPADLPLVVASGQSPDSLSVELTSRSTAVFHKPFRWGALADLLVSLSDTGSALF